MSPQNTSVKREWSIWQSRERRSLVTSRNGADLFGDLFVMWVQDRGDLSDWDDAPEFAAIVHAYSDLSLPVVTVWLGIEPSAVWDVEVPTSAPPWMLRGPEGETMVIDRTAEPIDRD